MTISGVLRTVAAICFGSLLAGAAASQELVIPPAVYPALAATAANAAAFAPQGWVVEAQAEGDLNKDGLADLAFVLHEANPGNVIKNPDGLGTSEIDTNPRMLAVAFRDGEAYRLVLENHALIPRYETPTIEDPFNTDNGLAISRGAVSVTLYSVRQRRRLGCGKYQIHLPLPERPFRTDRLGQRHDDPQHGRGHQAERELLDRHSWRCARARSRTTRKP